MADESIEYYKRLLLEAERRGEETERKLEEEQRRRKEEQRKLEEEQRRRKEEQSKLEEEQRRRKEEQRKLEEEQRRRKEEQRRRKEEQRRRKEAEKKNRKTTLPEFLDACHKHLHLALTVQHDTSRSTQGNPANANNKLRPEEIRSWEDFPARQEAVWDEIMESGFVLEQHFDPINAIETNGEGISRRKLSSELDLNVFQRSTVEDQVSLIVEHMYNDHALRQKCRLQGPIKFENHANTLSPETQLEEDMEQMSVSDNGPRRSLRLQGQIEATSAVPAIPAKSVRAPRPRADQFCIYQTSALGAEKNVAAFIVEYKAPHKLPLGYIYEGLYDMDLEDIVFCREPERDRFRRLMAAIITQAFSYMVIAGLEYGCVCTGEASIFLRVPEDPRTVYYFLSVPKGDVGETTGWSSNLHDTNRLHLTAIGQMLAFTLQALKTSPRSQGWRNSAIARLNSWEVVYQDLEELVIKNGRPSSEYRPPRHNDFLRMSPVRLRPRLPLTDVIDDQPLQNQHESSDESDKDTPSRQPPGRQQSYQIRSIASSSSPNRSTRSTRSTGGSRKEAQQGRYCTQRCLLGLVKGSTLDFSCPNVRDHGKDRHLIDIAAFLSLISQQLSEDLDTNCEPVSRPGACGVLFKVRLQQYGYTVAAKATPIYFVHRLRREATIYQHLRPIQGIYVPVYLGNIDLEVPYLYEGIACLVHMMLLSFGGKRISQQLKENREVVSQQVDISTRALHDLGVLHNDLMPRNILWNDETGKAMIIDFERAVMVGQPRPILGQISNNRNTIRKRNEFMTKKTHGDISLFTQERQSMTAELHGLG